MKICIRRSENCEFCLHDVLTLLQGSCRKKLNFLWTYHNLSELAYIHAVTSKRLSTSCLPHRGLFQNLPNLSFLELAFRWIVRSASDHCPVVEASLSSVSLLYLTAGHTCPESACFVKQIPPFDLCNIPCATGCLTTPKKDISTPMLDSWQSRLFIRYYYEFFSKHNFGDCCQRAQFELHLSAVLSKMALPHPDGIFAGFRC